LKNLRKIDCTQYSKCLDEIAKKRGKFSCTQCARYTRIEAVDDTFEQELNYGGPCATDKLHTPEDGAIEHRGVKMESQAEYKATSKKCTKCGDEKTLDEFSKSSFGKYGRRSICKICDAAFHQKRKPLYPGKRKSPRSASKIEETIAPASTVFKKLMDKAATHRKSGMPGEVLAEEHWAYVRGLLVAHGHDGDPDNLAKIEFHYKSAMIHGYKHGVDDRERAVQS